MNKYFKKLELVKNLYQSFSIDIDKVLDSYYESSFYSKIISDSYLWTEKDNLKLKDLLLGTNHHQDFRNIRQYAFSLLLNWLVEDLVYSILVKEKFDIIKAGSDKERKLLTGKEINSSPDLKINKTGSIWIEVISNYPTSQGYSSFWEQEGFFDLRDNKFDTLLEKSSEDKVIIIGVVVAKGKFFVQKIDFNVKTEKKYSERNMGYKRTTKIRFKDKYPILYDCKQLSDIINKL